MTVARQATTVSSRQGGHRLERTTFETSRLLEYFTERELVYQCGRPLEEWPLVVVKELVDNALDAAETADLPPVIRVVVEDRDEACTITVSGNGPGLASETVERILDFSTRTSDKEAYVSPTRGAQGNALKTIVAMPYVLSAAEPKEGRVTVASRGVRHEITVATDVLREEPAIRYIQAPDTDSEHVTSVSIALDYASIPERQDDLRFYKLLRQYALFNPHASFELRVGGETATWPALAPAWPKWTPCDPTSPWWYTAEDLGRLVAAHAVQAAGGARDLPLRELVAQFRGLSSTSKQKKVTAQLAQKRVSEFVLDGALDLPAVTALLAGLKAEARPVRPEHLGVIGETAVRAQLERWYALAPDCLRYTCVKGSEGDLPFVLEVALARKADERSGLEKFIGLNFSPSYGDPFSEVRLQHDAKRGIFSGTGMDALLREFKVQWHDPLVLVVHLAFPRPRFRDRGKTGLEVRA